MYSKSISNNGKLKKFFFFLLEKKKKETIYPSPKVDLNGMM